MTAAAEFVRIYDDVCRKSEESNAQWITKLRAAGIKAAHPDDGWVDRERNEIHLAYPQFHDGLEVGDLLALGYHFADTRLVEVTGFRENRVAIGAIDGKRFYVQFKEVSHA